MERMRLMGLMGVMAARYQARSIRRTWGPSQRALRHSLAKLIQSYFQSPGMRAKRAQ